MQKWSPKSESTWKTEQDRFCWNILTWSKSTVNGLVKSTVNEWRVLKWQCDVTLRLMWQYVKRSCRVWACGEHVEAVCPGAWGIRMGRGGAWSTCSWGRNFSWRMKARVMQFLAVLGWVLLGISYSVFLYLFFGSWMHTTLISECCRYFGRDGGGSLLTMATDEGKGSGRTPENITRLEQWL